MNIRILNHSKLYSQVTLALTLSFLILNSSLTQAADGRVLPAGRSRFSYTHARTGSISQTFNSQGVREDITAPYNIDLNSSNLSSFSADVNSLIDLLNATKVRIDVNAARGGDPNKGLTNNSEKPLLGDAMDKGFLNVSADGERIYNNFSIQHGLTDRLSAGFNIPLIKSSIRTRTAINSNGATLKEIYDVFKAYGGTESINEVSKGLAYLNAANVNTIQDILATRDYKRFEDTESSGLGDVVVGGRYNYLKSKYQTFISSAQFGLSVPTGRTKDTSILTDTDMGLGAWSMNFANVFNYSPENIGTNLMLSHTINFTKHIAGSKKMRVREDPSDFLPNASSEENVGVLYGNKLWTTLGLKSAPTDYLSFEVNYEWYWKNQDKFSGVRAKDYSYLSDATDLYMETLNLSAGFSTIQMFLAHQFPLPMDFGLNIFLPTQGKNAIIAPYGTAELALYF